MPSDLFYSTKNDLAGKELTAALTTAFVAKKRVQNGTYLGRSRVLVGGQEYQFQNTGGQTIEAGASIAVQNIGRRAAAIYAPTDLPTGLTGGGGGTTVTTTTVLTDHTHNTAYAQGGALTGYVDVTGDTMTGALTLFGAPTTDLHAATKAYADGLYTTFFTYIVTDNDSVVVNDGDVVWRV